MDFRERNLGASAVFLLPSLKLKEPGSTGGSPEERVHRFLMDNFGGYTAQAGNIFGYWRDDSGDDTYGEHREFRVACKDDSKLPLLKDFLARMAEELNEDCIYLCAGSTALLVYPGKPTGSSAA